MSTPEVARPAEKVDDAKIRLARLDFPLPEGPTKETTRTGDAESRRRISTPFDTSLSDFRGHIEISSILVARGEETSLDAGNFEISSA
eukprot:CAMPEP_0184367728 /NCGR_PEP_ID=MMETSP1089-20130417/159685_1 /TAXON_ID=38269 ORGANISM="Gloeochaete wittrockiana, Strain SAG46.84" /NCGR_SAMPLE_ID=MMETSP1089 /ASSEMBLY_ACC=CAM_ASM_000445 /LENGTH=87 /DNA_ID=CAMNT_0026709823 /DNA_START=525 /DNA_END=785 /DNA_ORIENTATION=-